MERRRPSLIGPLMLITIGVLFLLANQGTLPLTFWEIAARYWPLIFILIGLEIIIGRQSIIGGLIVLVLWIAIVGGVLWFSFTQASTPMVSGTTQEISQPLGDIKSATIDLNLGFARVDVKALDAGATDLAKGTLVHAEGTRVTESYSIAGNEGRLTLKEQGTNFMIGGTFTNRWELGLVRALPIALRVNGGFGSTSLDFSDLNLTSLNLDTGFGSVEVTTPQAGITTMQLHGGFGSTSIKIPQGVAARIRVHGGLGSTNVNQARFPQTGDFYQSANYATAENKIDISVEGGFGSTNIR